MLQNSKLGEQNMTETALKTTKTTKTTKVVTPAAVVRMTREEMVKELFKVKGVTFVQSFTTTEPKMNKTDNRLFGKVLKESVTNSMLGFDYENSMNLALQRDWTQNAIQSALDAGIPAKILDKIVVELKEYSSEAIDTFVAKPRQWGTHMVNPNTGKVSRIMIEHTKRDKKTKALLPETYARYVQLAVLGSKSPVYRYKDTLQELTAEDVEYIKQFFPARRDETIVVRAYTVENINRIHINRKQIIIMAE